MALPIALRLIDQGHVQVADIGARAQIILPDEPVEGDWRAGADIALVAFDLGYARQCARHVAERFVSALERRALGHVEDDLELGLVVEGQHLEDDRLDDDEATGKENQRDDAAEQHRTPAPCALAVEERHQQPVEHPIEPVLLARFAGPEGRRAAMPDEIQAQPRGHHQRDHQRQEHAGRRVDRNGTHIGAHEPCDECHGKECGDDRESREDRRPANLSDGTRNHFPQ